jgi:glycosyltransferase 2 family protein
MDRHPTRFSLIWVLGFAVSGAFSYLAFRNFQWTILKDMTAAIDPFPLALAGVFLSLSIVVRAYRWKFFLPEKEGLSFHSLVSGVAIGYFFSNIFPGRMGDLLRPGYAAKANNRPFHIFFYSVVLERIFELIMLLLFAAVLLELSGTALPRVLNIKIPFLLGFILAGLLFMFFSRIVLRNIMDISNYLNIRALSKSIQELLMSFEGNFRYERTAVLIFLSVMIFFMDGLVFVFALQSLGLQVTFIGKFTTMVVTSLAHLFPSAPAGVGVFHYFCQTSLNVFGVDKSVALSAAVLIHAFIFLCDFLLGLFFIFFGPLKAIHFLKGKAFSGI